eukprot:gnl/Chilomastix_cuspidata/1878.p1 GENE.gnl/Chilomastix_cuspidata/1878~~gnl/Chilomastix_cuspidata/1878.p1  ORF type:complete len:345 (-),score=126.33 gnl/Chilomastix_cuspidata/1878:145-1134(-)
MSSSKWNCLADDDDSGISSTTLNAILIVVILVCGGVGSLIPYLLRTGKKAKYVMSIGNAFGGGVFITAGLLHLLPEAIEDFSDLTNADYPYIELLAMFGFLLIFAIEYIFIDRDAHEMFHAHGHLSEHSSSSINIDSGNPESNPPDDQMTLQTRRARGADGVAASLIAYKPLTVWVLLIALSVHSIITGFGMGVQSDTGDIVVYFIAVISHKIVATFSMSVSIIRSPIPFGMGIGMNVVLCCMTPLGIGIGMIVLALVEDETVSDWISCIANAVASGTFLYVSICEIIIPEFSAAFDPTSKARSRFMQWMKFLAMIVGIVIMALVAIVL